MLSSDQHPIESAVHSLSLTLFKQSVLDFRSRVKFHAKYLSVHLVPFGLGIRAEVTPTVLVSSNISTGGYSRWQIQYRDYTFIAGGTHDYMCYSAAGKFRGVRQTVGVDSFLRYWLNWDEGRKGASIHSGGSWSVYWLPFRSLTLALRHQVGDLSSNEFGAQYNSMFFNYVSVRASIVFPNLTTSCVLFWGGSIKPIVGVQLRESDVTIRFGVLHRHLDLSLLYKVGALDRRLGLICEVN